MVVYVYGADRWRLADGSGITLVLTDDDRNCPMTRVGDDLIMRLSAISSGRVAYFNDPRLLMIIKGNE
jgi:hypothetical protein